MENVKNNAHAGEIKEMKENVEKVRGAKQNK